MGGGGGGLAAAAGGQALGQLGEGVTISYLIFIFVRFNKSSERGEKEEIISQNCQCLKQIMHFCVCLPLFQIKDNTQTVSYHLALKISGQIEG